MSQTNTLAPVAANARANSRPMPAAPAVIKTRCGIVAPFSCCILIRFAIAPYFEYNSAMKTELLSKALERIENWPADAQDQLAEIALDIDAGLKDVLYEPTDEESAGIERGLRDAAEGRFATDAEVAAAFAKFRRR